TVTPRPSIPVRNANATRSSPPPSPRQHPAVNAAAQPASSREPYSGNNEGASLPSRRAWQHDTRYSRRLLPCRRHVSLRHVSLLLKTRSTNRLPCWLSVPPLPFRHRTA